MAGIKYHYALDEHDCIVDIKQAYIERNDGHTYRCIGCGAEMIARLGVVRNWHFAHKKEETSCGTETYLHQLAKHCLKEKFDKESSFWVSYPQRVMCSDSSTCPFAKDEDCYKSKQMPFDLKKYYDTCEEEQQVGDYIADLLLTNSSMPNREPVLIEIHVSHKCTPQKRESGLRIIEIQLKTEEDITNLLSGSIVENAESGFGAASDRDTIGYAKFYGFKNKSSESKPLDCRSIPRFYLFSNGKAFVTNLDEFMSCRFAGHKTNRAVFEASVDSSLFGAHSIYEYGYAAAKQSGLFVKTCHFCKYHRSGFDKLLGNNPLFCCLHKEYGTPEYPQMNHALECSYYSEDKVLLKAIYESMPPIVIAL